MTKGRGGFDILGVFINIGVVSFILAPVVVTCMVCFLIIWKGLKLDPFYLTFAYIFPPGSDTYEHIYTPELNALALLVLGMPAMLEGGRTFALNLVNEAIVFICSVQLLKLIDQDFATAPISMSLYSRMTKAVQMYDRFCIIQIIGRERTRYISLVTLGIGYAILMFNAAATVTVILVLPLEVAWIPPAVTFVCLFMLINILPYGIACYNYSEKLLRRWRILVRTGNLQYIRKQLAARRPVGFMFGGFRPINKEFRLVYLESVMERTLNQILVNNSGHAIGM